MTVDQSGENVLFVEGDGYVEAHVQIRYQGDPARFAWLVPMPAVPEVSVGSQLLFDALLAGSTPLYGIRTTQMRCDGSTRTSESQGCAGGSASSASLGGVAMKRENAAEMMDPIGKTVGSFDVTILQPKSADEVLQWLSDNAFQLPARSLALLQPYVDAGSVFAAVRFAPGADVKEIHPIVFRYPGTRASIPLQLTAVAATPDMRVRVFFLGQGRMVPTNYRQLVLDDVKLDWPTYASNYENVVARAADETGDGHGFVTEYAGPSSVVGQSMVKLSDPTWNADAFEGTTPAQALAELRKQGQIDCSTGVCVFPHPLVLPLLQRYIPAPAGTSESAFYSCLSCAADQLDTSAWDAHAFASDYAERVVAPAQHAAQLLEQQPYLTRLLTFLSPDEMTADPVFHERDDLPAVARERWADELIPCKGAPALTLPDGREVTTDLGFSWPGSLAKLPYTERIEMVPLQGAPAVEADAAADIDAVVADWNVDPPMSTGVASASAATVSPPASSACRVSPALAYNVAWPGLGVLWLLWRRRRTRAG